MIQQTQLILKLKDESSKLIPISNHAVYKQYYVSYFDCKFMPQTACRWAFGLAVVSGWYAVSFR